MSCKYGKHAELLVKRQTLDERQRGGVKAKGKDRSLIVWAYGCMAFDGGDSKRIPCR